MLIITLFEFIVKIELEKQNKTIKNCFEITEINMIKSNKKKHF